MSSLQPKDVCEIITLEADSSFDAFLNSSPNGIALQAEPYGEDQVSVLRSSAGDFTKWMKGAHPNVSVTLPEKTDRLLLRNEEIWMPIAFLATDISLPIYLNIVSSYLYDRAKGLLKSDKPRVNLRVVYRDKPTGKSKSFNFSGDAETLKAIIKKIDLNEFFDERQIPK